MPGCNVLACRIKIKCKKNIIVLYYNLQTPPPLNWQPDIVWCSSAIDNTIKVFGIIIFNYD